MLSEKLAIAVEFGGDNTRTPITTTCTILPVPAPSKATSHKGPSARRSKREARPRTSPATTIIGRAALSPQDATPARKRAWREFPRRVCAGPGVALLSRSAGERIELRIAAATVGSDHARSVHGPQGPVDASKDLRAG